MSLGPRSSVQPVSKTHWATRSSAKLAESERVQWFSEKNERSPRSPDLNPLGYHAWGDMLEKYHELQLNPKRLIS